MVYLSLKMTTESSTVNSGITAYINKHNTIHSNVYTYKSIRTCTLLCSGHYSERVETIHCAYLYCIETESEVKGEKKR